MTLAAFLIGMLMGWLLRRDDEPEAAELEHPTFERRELCQWGQQRL